MAKSNFGLGGGMGLIGLGLVVLMTFAPSVLGALGGLILVALGLAIGYFAVDLKERDAFLLVGIALSVVSAAAFSAFGGIGDFIGAFFGNFAVLVVPFTLVVAAQKYLEVTK